MKKVFTLIFCWAIAGLSLSSAQKLEKVGGGIQGVYINDLAMLDGKLYAGGYFTPGNVAKDHVYSFNGAQWQSMLGGISGPAFPFISSFAVFNNKLFMSGAINQAGSYNTQDVAVWNGTGWDNPGGGVKNAKAMFTYNNQLYLGTTIIQSTAVNKALFWKWDGSSWQNIADSFGLVNNPNFDIHGIHTMTVYKGKLIVGGVFSSINGTAVNNIAAWDGTSWQAMGAGVAGYVYALKEWNGDLYVGGNFDSAGGKPTNFMTKWNGTEWTSIKGNLDQRVETFEVYNGSLWVGGQFFAPNRGILKYDGTKFDIPFVPDNGVTTLLADGNSLLIAGNFQKIDGLQYSLIARYTENAAGVHTPVKGTIGFYPNPATAVLHISNTGIHGGNVQLTVFDNIGRKVMETQVQGRDEMEVPVDGLPAGAYHITLLQGNTYTSGSFIKQ